MGDMLDKILTPLRNPSQASITDDPISEEVFDKEKSTSAGSRSSSRASGKLYELTYQENAWNLVWCSDKCGF